MQRELFSSSAGEFGNLWQWLCDNKHLLIPQTSLYLLYKLYNILILYNSNTTITLCSAIRKFLNVTKSLSQSLNLNILLKIGLFVLRIRPYLHLRFGYIKYYLYLCTRNEKPQPLTYKRNPRSGGLERVAYTSFAMKMNMRTLFCRWFEYLGERRMDVYHIGEFTKRGVLAHEDADLLDNIGTMSAIGMTAEDFARRGSE